MCIRDRYGDNVVDPSVNMNWYTGKTFLHLIETIEISKNKNPEKKRFPVQTIIRPHSADYHDYRGYAGRVAGGVFRPGDEVTVLPSLLTTTVAGIDTFSGPLEEAFPPMSVP